MAKRDFCWNRLTTSGALNLLYLKSLTNCCVPHTSSGVCQFLCGRVTQRVTQISAQFSLDQKRVANGFDLGAVEARKISRNNCRCSSSNSNASLSSRCDSAL